VALVVSVALEVSVESAARGVSAAWAESVVRAGLAE
jgi:hypothetical protein